MMRKRDNLKFLSQSVLLEEAGLPRINTLIILVIFTMVVSFIAWSITMKVDEVTKVKGFVVQQKNEDIKFSFKAKIPYKEIGNISEGLPVFISIPGLLDTNPIRGTINHIERTPITDQLGDAYYEAVVTPTNYKEMHVSLNDVLIPNMKTDVQIITGNKTLLSYLVGPIFKSVKKSF